MEVHDSSIWWHLFEQTPPVWRAVLGICTVGLFTLAGSIWRTYNRRMEKIEVVAETHATKADLNLLRAHVDTRFSDVEGQIGQLNTHVIDFIRDYNRRGNP